MKLYYTKGACSLVVRIIMNELGLSAEFESVDLRTKKTETGQDFFKMNPKGSVPTLGLDNEEFLTENAVILQYVADTTPGSVSERLLPKIGNLKRYRVLELLNYITTELHKSFGTLFNPSFSDALKEEIFKPIIVSKFKFLNNVLEKGGSTYLLGEDFTLPDAYLFVILLWSKNFKMDLKEFGALSAYEENLLTRESIKKSLQDEGFIVNL